MKLIYFFKVRLPKSKNLRISIRLGKKQRKFVKEQGDPLEHDQGLPA